MASYTVQKGDNLTKIAREAGIDIRDLVAANPGIGDTDIIQIGQRINIPTGTASAAARADAAARLASGSNERSRSFSMTGIAGQATLSEGQAASFRSLYAAGYSPSQILGTDYSVPQIGGAGGALPPGWGEAIGAPFKMGDEIFPTGATAPVIADISDEVAQSQAIQAAGGQDYQIPNYFAAAEQAKLRRALPQIVAEQETSGQNRFGLSQQQINILQRQVAGEAPIPRQTTVRQTPEVAAAATGAQYATAMEQFYASYGLTALSPDVRDEQRQRLLDTMTPSEIKAFQRAEQRAHVTTNRSAGIGEFVTVIPRFQLFADEGAFSKEILMMSPEERAKARADIEVDYALALNEATFETSLESELAIMRKAGVSPQRIAAYEAEQRAANAEQVDWLMRDWAESGGGQRRHEQAVGPAAIDPSYGTVPPVDLEAWEPRPATYQRSDYPPGADGDVQYILDRMAFGSPPSIQELNQMGFNGYVGLAQHIVDTGGTMPTAVTGKVWEEIATRNQWEETGEEFLERMGYALEPELGPDIWIRQVGLGDVGAPLGLGGYGAGYYGSLFSGGGGGGPGGGGDAGGGGSRGGGSAALYNWRIGAPAVS